MAAFAANGRRATWPFGLHLRPAPRRAGAPLGQQEAVVSIFPADQWLLDIKPLPQPTWQWPCHGAREVVPPPLVRPERKGQPLPGEASQLGWRRLAEAFVQGMEGWFNTMARQEVLFNTHVDVPRHMMHGVSAWTWAREAVTPEGSTGFTRGQGINRLVACGTELGLTGELRDGGNHARLRMRSQGQALPHNELLHEQAEPPGRIAQRSQGGVASSLRGEGGCLEPSRPDHPVRGPG